MATKKRSGGYHFSQVVKVLCARVVAKNTRQMRAIRATQRKLLNCNAKPNNAIVRKPHLGMESRVAAKEQDGIDIRKQGNER
eukprot:174658-Amphidinium_carterae.1